jgi:hypothetical protein
MSQTGVSASSTRIDLVGTCVSVVCAVHCLTAPLLVTVLPLAGVGVLLGGSLEILFIVASVVLATVSLCWGFRRHRRGRVPVMLSPALTMIAVGRFLASESYELVFVFTGAMVLAAGHLLNRYLCLTCIVCQDEPDHRGS